MKRRRNVPRDIGHHQNVFDFFAMLDAAAPDTVPTKPPELDDSGLPRNPDPGELIALDNFRLLPTHAATLEEIRKKYDRPRLSEYIKEVAATIDFDDLSEPDKPDKRI